MFCGGCRKFSLRSALWEWIIRLLFPKDPRPGAKQKLHLAKGSYLFYSIFFFFFLLDFPS